MDASQIRFDLADGGLAKPRRQPDGAVIYTGRVARTGSHVYPWGTERRDAQELSFIVNQLVGTPITVMHPSKLLSWGGQARIVGEILSARIDGEHAVAELYIRPGGVALIEAGIRELSLGYATKAVNGNHTNTRVDHLALVTVSRCGESCSVRVDHSFCCDSCAAGNQCAGNCASSGGFSSEVQIINQLMAMRGN